MKIEKILNFLMNLTQKNKLYKKKRKNYYLTIYNYNNIKE